MAHGPGVPGTHDVYPKIDDCYRVVHMDGGNVPVTNIDSTEAEEARRMGLNGHCGEVSISPNRPTVVINMKKRSATATWVREWKLDVHRANPLT
jgi:hypothetical protein